MRWRLWRVVLSIELRKTFSYRVDFWLKFLGALAANVAAAYFVWSAIFSRTGKTEIGGYTMPALILYYVLTPLIENISRSAEGSQVSDDIYSGGLTKFIVYPASFFGFKYVSSLASAVVGVVQLLAIVGFYLVFVGLPPEVAMTPLSFAAGIVVALAAGVLNFLIAAAMNQVAFWADRVWSLNVMMMFCVRMLGGAMLPLTMLPAQMQAVNRFLPFAYLVSFPVRTMMGQASLGEIGEGLAAIALWSLAMAAANRWIWGRGAHKYTGVGI